MEEDFAPWLELEALAEKTAISTLGSRLAVVEIGERSPQVASSTLSSFNKLAFLSIAREVSRLQIEFEFEVLHQGIEGHRCCGVLHSLWYDVLLGRW